jgi:hypothetical protein
MGEAKRNPSKWRKSSLNQLTLVFPEIPDDLEPVAPIPVVFSLRHIFVKGGMGPIGGAGYKPVLHRIIMNVVEMAAKIVFIPIRKSLYAH